MIFEQILKGLYSQNKMLLVINIKNCLQLHKDESIVNMISFL